MEENDILIGKIYNYWDRGIHTEDKRYDVLIIDKIPFEKSDKSIIKQWEQEKKDCYWLYAKKTNFFIKGVIDLGEKKEEVYFVKTQDNRWFSIGWWSGRLEEKD